MSRLLIIGAGWEQFDLIKEAKELGHYIIATHPTMNTDGFSLADRFFVKDSRDIESHLKIAEAYKVDAIVSDNCDYSFYTSSVVASKMELPFASIQSAVFCNNKFAQRNACSKKNILQPEYYQVETLDQIKLGAETIGYPVIVKPIDSRGTFGVTIVNNAVELKDAFFDAVCNSPSRRVICEKYIKGTLVTVDGFCFSNGHKSLTVASRVFKPGPKPITKEIVYPAQFSDELNTVILHNHEMVVEALGYSYGHTHGEYIVENNEVYLVECSNRGGGVYTSSTIVPFLTDINVNKILIDQSLGVDQFDVDLKIHNQMHYSVILAFLDFEENKVIRSINYKELQDLPFVKKYRTIFKESQMVESIENCASRHSMLVLTGEDYENSIENMRQFKKQLRVEYYD